MVVCEEVAQCHSHEPRPCRHDYATSKPIVPRPPGVKGGHAPTAGGTSMRNRGKQWTHPLGVPVLRTLCTPSSLQSPADW